MKLTSVLLLVACLQVSARTHSQVVSLHVKDAPLSKVLREIKKQTGYSFMYTGSMLNNASRVTVEADKFSLHEVLKICFSGQPFTYSIIDKTIVLQPKLLPDVHSPQVKELPPPIEIRGKIVDEDGNPLSNVSVLIAGTAIGTTTGADGTFIINAPEGKEITLEISSVGFKTKRIKPGSKTELIIALEKEVSGLNDIVVVGYGSQRKKTLTGAISSVSSSEITSTKSTSLVTNLQGKVPGLQIRQQSGEPGLYSSMVSIRGFGTPLVVIDGVVRDGISDLERLNANDIENISVLKDASAAIYGMNSDNGVIIVTTKSGHKGKTKFNYSAYYGTKQPTGMLKKEEAYNYMLLKNEMNKNSGLSPVFNDDVLSKWKAGSEPGYQNVDWMGLTLKKFTTNQQHDLSVSGGNDKVTYFSSVGFMQDNGLLKSDIQTYNKFNFYTSVAAQLSSRLKSEIKVYGKYDNNKGPQGTYFWLFKPIIAADPTVGPTVIDNPSHISRVPPEGTNAYAMMTESVSGYDAYSNLQYQTSVNLTYNLPFVKGLDFGILGAYDGNINNASNLKKGYAQYDYRTDALLAPAPRTVYRNAYTIFSRTDLQLQLAYKNTFNKVHNVNATMVYEARGLKGDNLSAQRQFDDVYTHDIIDQGSLTNAQNGGNRYVQHYLSYIGRFNYNYRSKYLLELAFREDGSFRYDPSRRWAFFPSASAGWLLSEEPFIRNKFSFLSNLKLRGSYGLMGEDAGDPFQYLAGYQFSNIAGGYVFNDGVLTNGMVSPGVVNNNLTWVKTKIANIGIDADMWNRAFGFSVDLFQRNRDGLLATRAQSITNTFGASFPQENLNSDLVRGVELSLRHSAQWGPVKIDLGANLTYSRRYLVHTERAPYASSMQKWLDPWGNNRYLGREWGYQYDGVYTSIQQYETAPLLGGSLGNSKNLPGSLRIIDANGDGVINGNDQLPIFWAGQYQGYATNPPLQYGFNVTAGWKNFDLNLLLQGAALFTVFTSPNDVWGYNRYPTIWSRYTDRWHTADPSADPFDPATQWVPGYWPALKSVFTGTTDGLTTDRWRHKANYMRIKSLEIGYNIPARILARFNIESLRLFVNGYNLYTFTNKDVRNLDPEREEGAYTADLTYPLMRSFNFGANLNF